MTDDEFEDLCRSNETAVRELLMPRLVSGSEGAKDLAARMTAGVFPLIAIQLQIIVFAGVPADRAGDFLKDWVDQWLAVNAHLLHDPPTPATEGGTP